MVYNIKLKFVVSAQLLDLIAGMIVIRLGFPLIVVGLTYGLAQDSYGGQLM